MVRTYLEKKIPDESVYLKWFKNVYYYKHKFSFNPHIIMRTYFLIVGTYGTKIIMNEKNSNKNSVRIPAFYWTAFCYVSDNDEGNSVSWVYMQENDKESRKSSGENFMSVKDFAKKYYKV